MKMKKLSHSENEENDKIKTVRMQVIGEGEEGVWKSVEAVDEEGGWRLRSLSLALSPVPHFLGQVTNAALRLHKG